MRQIIKDFVEIVSQTIPFGDRVYEFGSLQVAGQEGFADMRPLFYGKEYVGVDMRAGVGVDIQMDIHKLDLLDESVDLALCLDTLEHVENPHEAVEEMYRVLSKDGILVMSSVFNFPIHEHPRDYWRFTPESFRLLMKDFTSVFIRGVGKKDLPHTVVGVGFKGIPSVLDDFLIGSTLWETKYSNPRLTLRQKIRRFVPQILLKVQ